MASVVERYLRAVVDHDWSALADCLADDVVRVGPFGDTYTPKGPYVAFLEELMPSLEAYSMKVERIVDAGARRRGGADRDARDGREGPRHTRGTRVRPRR